jgi:hypothetical protein
MDKAMRQAHGVGYRVYSQNLNVRMKVEEKRERSYMKSNQILNDVNRRVYG